MNPEDNCDGILLFHKKGHSHCRLHHAATYLPPVVSHVGRRVAAYSFTTTIIVVTIIIIIRRLTALLARGVDSGGGLV